MSSIGEQIDAKLQSLAARLDTLEGRLAGFQRGTIIRLDGQDRMIESLAARVAALEAANEAWFEGKLHRWDGKPERTPKEGEIAATFPVAGKFDLFRAGPAQTGIVRRIFVPVDEPADPPLPEGVRREMRPVLYVPTQGGEEAEIRGIMKCEHCYCLNGTVGGVSVTWGLDGERAIAMEPQNDLTVSLPADEWKRLLGVANKPEDTER